MPLYPYREVKGPAPESPKQILEWPRAFWEPGAKAA